MVRILSYFLFCLKQVSLTEAYSLTTVLDSSHYFAPDTLQFILAWERQKVLVDCIMSGLILVVFVVPYDIIQ